ncbi:MULTISPECIES: hypothetical protein [Shewanella]|uniref:Uncharacterized protein n=1 Tax=Shewanella japonica TaxID=93973 RepID=A0ABM6JM69_9GAMM|nr:MULTISPECIES: hypothetical protein [Shewanella]ARD22406.1 hypothetical protein SJ2017_2108 [Shewanella japonica]KPZ70685.1 hypothetical protein AN944_02121 [Shewanella sp. P1-14-1]MBQ4888870.1 hypothetical protein [Shewanella sp. MMG014]OBT11433.1 hypothetical protein A9267_01970 [Shewanella sp. UCD-FRSSP16_17]
MFDNKLIVLYRLEPGCLGPDGIEHIDTFCQLAQQTLANLDTETCQWFLEPRFDKKRDEMAYCLANKMLTRAQAAKYLHRFGQDLELVQETFEDKLTLLINQYIARKS